MAGPGGVDPTAAAAAAAAFDEEEDDLDDSEGDDTDLDDDSAAPSDLISAPPNPNANPNPVPNPPPDPSPPPQNGAIQLTPISSSSPGGDVKRPRLEERRPVPSASIDESRRLFQRLWTDDDEIKILTRFFEFTSSRGTTFASHQYDTGPFYEQIKNELQLDFNKNQLIEKLRRLKKKYRNTANRMMSHGQDFAFRSPHEKATYDIAKNIWSVASVKAGRDSDDDDLNPYGTSINNVVSDAGMSSDRKNSSRSRRRARKRGLETFPQATMALPVLPSPPLIQAAGSSDGVVKVEVQSVPMATQEVTTTTPVQKKADSPVPNVIQETVKSCLSPVFKELLNFGIPASVGLGANFPPLLNLGVGNLGVGNLGNLASDEKWKKQQILELEVYLKRVELIREHVKATLEELKASPPSGS